MKKIFCLLVLILPVFAFAQPWFPENDILYDDSEVPRIDITIEPSALDEMYADPWSDFEHPATFKFTSSQLEETYEEIGFRFRGNTSRNSNKKSFKVSFNTYISGGDFQGVEKLNINGEHNDPSIIRSKIGWDVFRSFDIPASRSNHVQLYINNEYYGLYISVEHIDEEFVKKRFGNNDGNLFKCLWPADLAYLGDNPELYKNSGYELKINEEEDDFSDLAHFIDILNNTPTDQLACKLEAVFNVYDYLKVAAVEIMLGHWDGYIYNKNNYYLYHNTESGKFEYIPYDLDNTLGIDWIGRDWSSRNIYDWAQHGSEQRPLYTRLMEVPEYKAQFSFYMNQLTQEIAASSTLIPKIEEIRDRIEGFVSDDPLYPLDYGWNYNDFQNSYNQTLGGHVSYGLFPYIESRNSNTQSQLDLSAIDPIVKYIRTNKPILGQPLMVSAYVESDNNENLEVKMLYEFNCCNPGQIEMFDDGEHNDGEAGDNVYGAITEPFNQAGEITYQIEAESENGNQTVLPCISNIVTISQYDGPYLFVNEIMASNETTIADEEGEFDDWVEIYNEDDVAVSLEGYYLTDNIENQDKWAFPNVEIQPNGFLLVWADDDVEQGELHADFKLSKSGEDIYIFYDNNGVFEMVDGYPYGEQTTDISYGYSVDGGPDLMFFDSPTPDSSNNPQSINDFDISSFSFYPNPVNSNKIFFNQKISGFVYNLNGVKMMEFDEKSSLTIDLMPGLYFLQEKGSPNVVKILVQ